MMRQKMVVLSILVLLFGFTNLSAVKAADNSATVITALQALDTKLSTKLDELSKKQDDILTQLADIKTELNIVKIRASLKT